WNRREAAGHEAAERCRNSTIWVELKSGAYLARSRLLRYRDISRQGNSDTPPLPYSPQSNRSARRFLAHLAALSAFLVGYGSMPAKAAITVYHCKKNGQTVLTDWPCEGSADSSNPENPRSAEATP